MKPTHLHPPGRCRMIDEVLSLIGDKWSIYVVVMLGQGKRRFSELKREVDGISQKMLTVTLRGLERDGYVTRTAYATIPPRVEYELTELGQDLLVPVRALGDWANRNESRVVGARIRYDARRAQAAE
ncbi:helix-turn-helix domain-containing protein [Aureimonas sp. AU12]|jgi:DNA-binding HxlR family transcriptional regulator|uniref:winged helix-turn-helix transcriptional regulator n=1 Tax=Aureimonas sp. AU12 TaxID=1638161 RepID=UPI0007806D75|nr:helix-turn-helix domain-containing protein [Aureimonas sp. AU12]